MCLLCGIMVMVGVVMRGKYYDPTPKWLIATAGICGLSVYTALAWETGGWTGVAIFYGVLLWLRFV